MPDLLAHALIAFAIARVLSVRYDWLAPGYTTVVMAGAFVPDLSKVRLVFPSDVVHRMFDVPFDWSGLHTAGGSFVAILIGVVVVSPRDRRVVGALLSVGAASHLLADALLQSASGRSYALLWPVTRYHPPTPGLYLSTQPEPTVVAAAVALAVWVLTR